MKPDGRCGAASDTAAVTAGRRRSRGLRSRGEWRSVGSGCALEGGIAAASPSHLPQRDPGWELPTRSVQAAVAGTALGGIEASLGLGLIGGVGWGGLRVRPFAKEWGGASPLRTGTVSCLDTAVGYCLAWRRKMQINQPASQPCGLHLLAAGPGS